MDFSRILKARLHRPPSRAPAVTKIMGFAFVFYWHRHFESPSAVGRSVGHARCSHSNIFQPDVYKTNAKLTICAKSHFPYKNNGFHHFCYQIPASRSWLSDPGFQNLATRFWLPDPGYLILATRCWLPDPGNQIQATRSWLPDPGYQILATSTRNERSLIHIFCVYY